MPQRHSPHRRVVFNSAILLAALLALACDTSSSEPEPPDGPDAATGDITDNADDGPRDDRPDAAATSTSYCAGIRPSCSSLSTSECYATLGCHEESECTGTPTSCYSIFSSYSCWSQQGCYWSSSSNTCSGYAASCASISTCALQQGCRTTYTCAGEALTLCEDLTTEYVCEETSGCYWVE